jgi:hypothetical protein
MTPRIMAMSGFVHTNFLRARQRQLTRRAFQLLQLTLARL